MSPVRPSETIHSGDRHRSSTAAGTSSLFNEANELLVQIEDNELVFSTAPWDVELVGQTLTIRSGAGDIFVRMRFEPPSGLILDRAKIFRNGLGLEVTPDEIALANNGTLSGGYAENQIIGLAVGDPPQVEAAFTMRNPPRSPFAEHPQREDRVLRLHAD